MWTSEPIVGYRGWNWDGKYLKAGYGSWKTGVHLASHSGDVETHTSPHWSCLCGVNVFKEPNGPGEYYPILGKIELTGLVIEYEFGYRGEIGTIIKIAIWKGFPKMLSTDGEEFKEKVESVYPDALVTLERKLPWRK